MLLVVFDAKLRAMGAFVHGFAGLGYLSATAFDPTLLEQQVAVALISALLGNDQQPLGITELARTAGIPFAPRAVYAQPAQHGAQMLRFQLVKAQIGFREGVGPRAATALDPHAEGQRLVTQAIGRGIEFQSIDKYRIPIQQVRRNMARDYGLAGSIQHQHLQVALAITFILGPYQRQG